MQIDPQTTGRTIPDLDASSARVALVAARFNGEIVEALVEGARECLLSHGVADSAIDVVRVPGAWELPLGALYAARSGAVDGVVALGCVIRGETPHFEYVSAGAADGLQRVALDLSLPVGLGVLTVEDEDQARARSGGAVGNVGWDAALAVLEMWRLGRGSG